MQTISRDEAKVKGLTRYFSGTVCPYGHVSERRVSDYGCVECSRLKARDPKKRERRREYMRLRQIKYRAEHPNRVRACRHKNYWKDPEKSRQMARDSRARSTNNYKKVLKNSYQRHKVKRLAESKLWRENNPERANEHSRIAKAKRRTADSKFSFTLRDIGIIFLKQERKCAAKHCRCDISDRFEIDHIIPLSRGGHNRTSNIQLLCIACNRSKGHKTEKEWSEYRAIQAVNAIPNPPRISPSSPA